MGNAGRIHYAVALATSIFLTVPADARQGTGGLIDLMNSYVGKPVTELVELIGYPTKQEQVLDRVVLIGGFDSEDSASCQWWVTIDSNRIVREVRIFGNDWGCGEVRKRAVDRQKNRDTPRMEAKGTPPAPVMRK